MSGRSRIGCGLLAGMIGCLLAPSVADAASCPLPSTVDATMNNTVLDVEGQVAANKAGGYLQIPFTVPAGSTGIRVRYSYDQPGDGANPGGQCSGSTNTLDMGVYQPKATPASPIFESGDERGWSGSAVKDLAISPNGFTSDAVYGTTNATRKAYVSGNTTRAYRPGPIQPGEWAVELGLAYIAPDTANDNDGIHYHVLVETSTDSSWSNAPYVPSGPAVSSINNTPGWYTGDMHLHGEQEPGNATMTETFASAFDPAPAGAGLDFITLVDHNNRVAHNNLEGYQAAHPNGLIIPGTEVTTYRGHWNNQGSSNFADFRTGPVYGVANPGSSATTLTDGQITQKRAATPPKNGFATAQAGNGWTQVNHPATYKDAPASCRGCAWTYSDADTDFSKVDAIEISNSIGQISAGPFTLDAIAYYEHALDTGAHIAATGSSDAHKAANDPISHTGEGVTVVHSESLSKAGIMAGVKADHTYVKPFGPSGPDISLGAMTPGGATGIFGDSLSAASLTLNATVSGAASAGRTGSWKLNLLKNGVVVESVPFAGDGITHSFTDSGTGRYSLEVTRTSGPTYIEDYSSPIWFTAVANEVKVKKTKLNKKKGTATLQVKVPGPGSLTLTGDSLAKSSAAPTAASTVKLKVKPKGKLKKKLKKKGKLTAKAKIKFMPTGGEPATEKAKVKLKYKKKKG